MGCRDAGYSRNLQRASAELGISVAILESTKNDDPEKILRLHTSLDLLKTQSRNHSDEILLHRHEIYAGYVQQIEVTNEKTSVFWSNAVSVSIFSAISVGHKLIEFAILQGDARRCEIEADHIHNLPVLISPDHEKSKEYYLEKERYFYLDQLEKHTGIDTRNEMSKRFEQFWNLIERNRL